MRQLSEQGFSGRVRPGASLWRGLAWCVASLAGLAAAATVRARRSLSHVAADPNIIEARHVGGHSWVAYGWDDRR